MGINKAEDDGRMPKSGFANELQRVSPTAVARWLEFRGWIRQEILYGRSSVTFDLRQCAAGLIVVYHNLKAEHAAACDDNYDFDRLAALFVEDATWESEGMGCYEGREGIREFFRSISGHFVFDLHYGLNPQTEAKGDTARARWYLFMPCKVGDTREAVWHAGLDEEGYIMADGRWMYRSKRSAPTFHTTFEQGWARQRFV